MRFFVKGIIAALALNGLAVPAAAQAQNQPMSLTSDVKLVKVDVDENGESSTSLVAPDVIVPGDRLVFGTNYANSGSDVVEGFVVTNPVHEKVRLASDADPDLTVSVDGGKSWGKLDALNVTGEDGTSRSASHADVTHVRWVLATVQPGESGRLEYPVIIR